MELDNGLFACVEVEAVEFQACGSRVPELERRDRIAFDLDPGEDVGFEEVKQAAFELREARAGLVSWPLLSDGKGVHVVFPFRWQVRHSATGLINAGNAWISPEEMKRVSATIIPYQTRLCRPAWS